MPAKYKSDRKKVREYRQFKKSMSKNAIGVSSLGPLITSQNLTANISAVVQLVYLKIAIDILQDVAVYPLKYEGI